MKSAIKQDHTLPRAAQTKPTYNGDFNDSQVGDFVTKYMANCNTSIYALCVSSLQWYKALAKSRLLHSTDLRRCFCSGLSGFLVAVKLTHLGHTVMHALYKIM